MAPTVDINATEHRRIPSGLHPLPPVANSTVSNSKISADIANTNTCALVGGCHPTNASTSDNTIVTRDTPTPPLFHCDPDTANTCVLHPPIEARNDNHNTSSGSMMITYHGYTVGVSKDYGSITHPGNMICQVTREIEYANRGGGVKEVFPTHCAPDVETLLNTTIYLHLEDVPLPLFPYGYDCTVHPSNETTSGYKASCHWGNHFPRHPAVDISKLLTRTDAGLEDYTTELQCVTFRSPPSRDLAELCVPFGTPFDVPATSRMICGLMIDHQSPHPTLTGRCIPTLGDISAQAHAKDLVCSGVRDPVSEVLFDLCVKAGEELHVKNGSVCGWNWSPKGDVFRKCINVTPGKQEKKKRDVPKKINGSDCWLYYNATTHEQQPICPSSLSLIRGRGTDTIAKRSVDCADASGFFSKLYCGQMDRELAIGGIGLGLLALLVLCWMKIRRSNRRAASAL